MKNDDGTTHPATMICDFCGEGHPDGVPDEMTDAGPECRDCDGTGERVA